MANRSKRQTRTDPREQPLGHDLEIRIHLNRFRGSLAGLAVLAVLQVPIGPPTMNSAQLFLKQLLNFRGQFLAQTQQALESELTALQEES